MQLRPNKSIGFLPHKTDHTTGFETEKDTAEIVTAPEFFRFKNPGLS